MYTTRFNKEISGEFGEFWKKQAQQRVESVKSDFANKQLTVDDNGVLRNCIGRVATKEIQELCTYANIVFNEEATKVADQREIAESIKEYCEYSCNHITSDEELFEMRAAFGTDVDVIDVISGKVTHL